MFIRPTFILLLISFIPNDCSKINEIIKNVGKRMGSGKLLMWRDRETRVKMDDRYLTWKNLPDEEIVKIKDSNAHRVKNDLVGISSIENPYFNESLLWISSVLDPNMVAKVCGAKDQMNSYQFMKYLAHMAGQYKRTYNRGSSYQIATTDRDVLQFKVHINHTDLFNMTTKIEYDITMKLALAYLTRGVYYSITRVDLGGNCLEHGIVSYSDPIDRLIDDIEELKSRPTARLFLRLFTPQRYQLDDQDPHKLPRFWLSGLHPDETKINVCHEGVADTVGYTVDQFLSWYKHFGLMWHPKEDREEDDMELQVIEMKDDSIIARVTMKLQMGRDKEEKVHDWNFKFSAKQKIFADNVKVWYIDHVEVLCTATVDLKDQSLLSIRDVVAGNFVDDILDLPPPSQWYSSVEFVKRFTKHESVEFHYCDYDKTAIVTQIELFVSDGKVERNVKFLKYWVDHKDVTLPAPDSATFRFKTWSVADTKDPGKEHEHEWKFDVKWDQMDQFYYIEKLEIGCEKQYLPGQNEDEYISIFYEGFIGGGKR